ncbi:MAG: hypothetical protein AABZ74_10450 [Cyanobacteriota bacterium]
MENNEIDLMNDYDIFDWSGSRVYYDDNFKEFFYDSNTSLEINLKENKDIDSLLLKKNIYDNEFSFEKLKEFRNLEKLDVEYESFFKYVNEYNFTPISYLEKLKYLKISGMNFDNLDGIEKLTNLRVLHLNWLPKLQKISDKIKNLENLERIYLSDLSNFSLGPISELKNLRALVLENIFFEKDLDFIGELTSLECLIMDGCLRGDYDYEKDRILVSSGIKSYREVEDNGCIRFPKEIKHFKKLKTFFLNGDPFRYIPD